MGSSKGRGTSPRGRAVRAGVSIGLALAGLIAALLGSRRRRAARPAGETGSSGGEGSAGKEGSAGGGKSPGGGGSSAGTGGSGGGPTRSGWWGAAALVVCAVVCAAVSVLGYNRL